MDKETAIATRGEFNLASMNEDVFKNMAADMGSDFDLSTIITRLRVPSGGGIAFEIPNESGEPDIKKEIVGVIVDHHPANAFWAEAYDGQTQSPNCYSPDGLMGIGEPGGECRTCPQNRWGSGEGKGKACKNTHKLYILQAGDILPVQLTLPPTSIQNFKNYIAKNIALKGLRLTGVVTKITLVKSTSTSGIVYSKVNFAVEDVLTPDEAKRVMDYSEGIKNLTRSEAMVVGKFEPAEGVGGLPF